MANPQLEDGHTQIANEILEHLVKMHLSPNQWQVLLCVIRKTYGFHKKVDYIANFQICDATGLCKAVVSRSLEYLERVNLIYRQGKYIGLQKDWERWGKLAERSTKVSSIANNEKLAEQSTLAIKLAEQSTNGKLAISTTKLAISTTELAEQSTKVSSCAVAQKIKDTITKDTIQKKEYGEFRNVKLFGEEYESLVVKFGEVDAIERIERLSSYIASKNKRYNSHYATILNWARRDNGGCENGTRANHRENRSIPGNRGTGAFADLDV